MATLITKNSSTASSVPTAAQLVQGELAVNVTDKRLFTENSSGTVVELGTNPSTLALPNGTANGVAYLNGSKVLTTGSALTFDGTNLGVGVTPTSTAGTSELAVGSASTNPRISGIRDGVSAFVLTSDSVGSSLYERRNLPFLFGVNNTEQMRLTSTGLGIGTSSPFSKLDVKFATDKHAILTASASYSNSADLIAVNDAGSEVALGLGGSTVRFYTGATERARIDSSGNLGIGTSSPDASVRLTVAKNDGIIQIQRATGTTYPFSFGIASDGRFNIYNATTASESLAITQAGNLGLGVTPSAWDSSYKAVRVNNFTLASQDQTGGGELSKNSYVASGGANTYIANGFATKYEQTAGTHKWFTAASGTAGNTISFTQAMTLDASGNLGVGVTSPTVPIEVQSNSGGTGIIIRGRATANSGTLRFYANNGTTQQAKFEANDTTVEIGSITNVPLLLYANGSERARITSGGQFLFSGLTTSVGNYWIQVKNTGSSSNCAYFENASGNDRGILVLKHDQAAGATTGAMVGFQNSAGTTVGTITSSNTATAYNTSSDYRLKDNQQPLTGSGAFIDALQPKTWNWKTDGSKGVGFIAHEVQAISPGSVVGVKDAVDEEGKPVMQAMEYGSAEFIANIIAEIQSLRARVAALESNP